MRVALLLLATLSAHGQTITWTLKSSPVNPPGLTGYSSIHYDPVSGQIIAPSVANGNGTIYTNSFYAFRESNKTWTFSLGQPDLGTVCGTADATMFGNVHLYRQFALDTTRNRLWFWGGPNMNCSACTGPNCNPRRQMYYISLNSDPSTNTLTQVTPSTWPQDLLDLAGGYDPNVDVIVGFGGSYRSSGQISVYCPSASLSAPQTAAGCSAPQTWSQVTPQNGLASVSGTAVTRISGDSFTSEFTAGDYMFVNGSIFIVSSVTDADHLTLTATAGTSASTGWFPHPIAVTSLSMNYDSTAQQFIMFGGANQAQTAASNQTFYYDAANKKFHRKALLTTPPPAACILSGTGCNGAQGIGQPGVAWDNTNRKLYYHYIAPDGSTADYVYSAAADTWSTLTTVGTGSQQGLGILATWDATCNCMITYSAAGSGQTPNMWAGVVTSGASSAGTSISGRFTCSGRCVIQ